MTVGLQVPALDRERSDIAAAELAVGNRQGALDESVSKNAGARESGLGPLEQKITQTIGQPAPERRQVDLPKPNQAPIVDAKEYQQLSYGLVAMAMLGGIASKGNWLGVADSLNGALKGYAEGSVQKAEKAYADYDRLFKKAFADEQQANKEFESILQQRNISINEMISQYRVAAAKYDRQDALSAAQQRSVDRMWQAVESRKGALSRLETQHEAQTARVDEQRRHNEMMEALAKAKAGSGASAGLSERYTTDPTYKKNVDYWAKYVQQGNSLPARFAQSGAGKVMMPDIINVVPTLGSGNPGDMMANKLSLKEMNAEAQKLGTQAASVAIANKELMRFIPLAEKAIDNVPRTGWKPINQLVQAGENSWSPQQKSLVIANRSVQNAFAQLIQRGAPTVHSLSEAEALLNTADSPAVYKAAMKQLTQEGEQAEAGLNDARDDLLKRARSVGSETPQGAAPASAIPAGWSVKEH